MTFKVIIRTDVIYKDNSSPLCLLFFHDGRKKSVGLGVSVVRSCWDAQAQKVTDDCPDKDDIQFQITAKIKEYEKKIKKLEALEIPVTFEALFETIGKRMDCTVGYYFRQIIDRLEKVEKYGSASKHKVTLALMSQFRSVNMRFDELDLTYLREFEIFLSQKGNVNNSCNYAAFQYCLLYLIEILHQTTTFGHLRLRLFALYLIEILHQTTTMSRTIAPTSELYLIEIPHQTTTQRLRTRSLLGCILSKFHIKPQPVPLFDDSLVVVSYRNSTSNHNGSNETNMGESVVSYRNSTSNHNSFSDVVESITVVSYRNSTSNHNKVIFAYTMRRLYLIEILHQTTTTSRATRQASRLYLIEILHQTTTVSGSAFPRASLYLIEILHQTTTRSGVFISIHSCILSKFYIKPQLPRRAACQGLRCILSKFYIKPQLPVTCSLIYCVVSYRNSTSNHNFVAHMDTQPSVVSYRNSTSNHNCKT